MKYIIITVLLYISISHSGAYISTYDSTLVVEDSVVKYDSLVTTGHINVGYINGKARFNATKYATGSAYWMILLLNPTPDINDIRFVGDVTSKGYYYSESGNLEEVEHYVKGKLVKKDVYHDNGAYKGYIPYDGILNIHGIVTVYDEFGNLYITKPYINGKRQGTTTQYYANGEIKLTNEYVDGRRNGILKYYNRSGTSVSMLYNRNDKVYKIQCNNGINIKFNGNSSKAMFYIMTHCGAKDIF